MDNEEPRWDDVHQIETRTHRMAFFESESAMIEGNRGRNDFTLPSSNLINSTQSIASTPIIHQVPSYIQGYYDGTPVGFISSMRDDETNNYNYDFNCNLMTNFNVTGNFDAIAAAEAFESLQPPPPPPPLDSLMGQGGYIIEDMDELIFNQNADYFQNYNNNHNNVHDVFRESEYMDELPPLPPPHYQAYDSKRFEEEETYNNYFNFGFDNVNWLISSNPPNQLQYDDNAQCPIDDHTQIDQFTHCSTALLEEEAQAEEANDFANAFYSFRPPACFEICPNWMESILNQNSEQPAAEFVESDIAKIGQMDDIFIGETDNEASFISDDNAEKDNDDNRQRIIFNHEDIMLGDSNDSFACHDYFSSRRKKQKVDQCAFALAESAPDLMDTSDVTNNASIIASHEVEPFTKFKCFLDAKRQKKKEYQSQNERYSQLTIHTCSVFVKFQFTTPIDTERLVQVEHDQNDISMKLLSSGTIIASFSSPDGIVTIFRSGKCNCHSCIKPDDAVILCKRIGKLVRKSGNVSAAIPECVVQRFHWRLALGFRVNLKVIYQMLSTIKQKRINFPLTNVRYEMYWAKQRSIRLAFEKFKTYIRAYEVGVMDGFSNTYAGAQDAIRHIYDIFNHPKSRLAR